MPSSLPPQKSKDQNPASPQSFAPWCFCPKHSPAVFNPGIRALQLLLAGLVVLFGALLEPAALAADAIVTSAADSGPGSLREAISQTSDGVIRFSPALDGGSIVLGSELIIDGGQTATIDASALPLGLTIDGGPGVNRLFTVNAGSFLTLKGLRLTGGGGSSVEGGAVLVAPGGASFAAEQCSFFRNKGSFGGGISIGLGSSVSLKLCTCYDNSAAFGGCVYNAYGAAAFEKCTFYSNTASFGSVIFSNGEAATTTMTGCTVYANGSGSNGRALINSGSTTTLRHCTITGNSGGFEFSGSPPGTLAICDTIMAGNTSSSDFSGIAGTVLRSGANIVGKNGGYESAFPAGFPNANGDFAGTSAAPVDPKLAPLGDFGGRAKTCPPLADSPAINRATGPTIIEDQRGFPPLFFPDIGAAEAQISSIPGVTTDEDFTTAPLPFFVGVVGTLTLETNAPQLAESTDIDLGGEDASRTIEVTPKPNKSGSVTVTVRSSHGESRSFVVVVRPVYDAPTITVVPDQTTDEDVALGPVAFTLGSVEVPPSSLTVTKTSSNPPLIPLDGIVLGGSGANRTVTLAPALNQSGSSRITLTVSDGISTAISSFLVTVNSAPEKFGFNGFTDKTIDEDTAAGPFSAVIEGENSAVGTLLLTAVSSNAALVPNTNVAFTGSGAGRQLMITPVLNQSGSTTITVTVRDSVAANQASFVVTVLAVNDPPVISAVSDRTINEDEGTGVVGFNLSDVDSPVASFTVGASSSNLSLVPLDRIVLGGSGANRTIVVTPVPDQSGTAVITITASDGAAGSSRSFRLVVNPVNDPPSLSTPSSQTIVEDSDTGILAFTVADLETAAGDLVVTASSSDTTVVPPGGIVLGGSGADRTISITPAPNQSGAPLITLTVSDGVLSVSRFFSLAVISVNDPPVVSAIADVAIQEDGTTGVINFTVADVETAASALSVTAASSDASVVPQSRIVLGGSSGARTISITPAANMNGVVTITISASDGLLTTTRSFKLTIQPVADFPTISAITDKTINEDSTTGSFAFTVAQPDMSPSLLTLSATTSNPTLVPLGGILFGGSGSNRSVTVIPVANLTGFATIGITVSDGVHTAATNFFLVVNPVNDAPTFTAKGGQIALASSGPQTVPGWATGMSTGPPNEGDQFLTGFFVASNSNPSLFSAGPAVSLNGTLTYTPAAGLSGSATVSVVLRDSGSSVSPGTNTSLASTFVIQVRGPVAVVSSATEAALRGALASAAAVGGIDSISFSSAVSGQTIDLLGALIVSDPDGVVVDATSLAGGVTIRTLRKDRRLLEIAAGSVVTVKGVALTGGNQSSSGRGGAIENNGTLTLERCALYRNWAGEGGAVYSSSLLNLKNCTLSENYTTGGSGAGSAISTGGVLNMIHCTVSGNSAWRGGGAVHAAGVGARLANCIVAANPGGDFSPLSAGIAMEGANLIGDKGPTGVATGPLVGTASALVDPRLSPISDYGGATRTMPPMSGSPAIDAAQGSTELVDQNGFVRPVDGDANGTVAADLGASERRLVLVTTASDELDSPAGAFVSLREAIRDGVAGSRIGFDPVIFGQSGGSGAVLTLTRGEIPVGKSLFLDGGNNPVPLALDAGAGASRLFSVSAGVELSCSGMELTGGGGAGAIQDTRGGCIFNQGAVNLTRCRVSGNAAASDGGGIYNDADASLFLSECTVSGNDSGYAGGGVYHSYGRFIIERSTFSGNNAAEAGGAIFCTGSVVAERSTFAGNSASGGSGGAVAATGFTGNFRHCTLTGNAAPVGSGGAFLVNSGNLALDFCIVSGNAASNEPNLAASFSGAGNVINTNALLAPLGRYGGATETMPLLVGSPARDAATTSTTIIDQRGVVIAGVPDTGACEAGGAGVYDAWIWETLPASTSHAQHLGGFDYDGDGKTNEQEWGALTDPADGKSFLRVASILQSGGQLGIYFTSVPGRNYSLEYFDPGSSVWLPAGGTVLAGNGGTLSFSVSAPAGGVRSKVFRVRAGP